MQRNSQEYQTTPEFGFAAISNNGLVYGILTAYSENNNYREHAW